MAEVMPLRSRRHHDTLSSEAREAIDATIAELVILAARRQALADHLAAMQPRTDTP